MPVTQEEIREHLRANVRVVVQVAGPGDGSPEVAWGDTFFYVRDHSGHPKKMPFVTIVTKDYEGFDTASNLDRGGLFRLNIDVGKEKFEALFGFEPRDLELYSDRFDVTSVSQLFPHPVYGASSWVSIINPGSEATDMVNSILEFSLERALERSRA
ncbi:MAG: hypothetical protein JJT87_17745 [Halomonas sp.]|nr:DUF6194 family protein [Halomonas sp.]MCC5903761.1 hypothetical protein [Halomonas sp.]